jgi:glutathione S-transferase
MTGERRLSLETKLGYAALGVMDGHLEYRDFFVADRYSITDIALYAYPHVAGERGFELDLFPCPRLARAGAGATGARNDNQS